MSGCYNEIQNLVYLYLQTKLTCIDKRNNHVKILLTHKGMITLTK